MDQKNDDKLEQMREVYDELEQNKEVYEDLDTPPCCGSGCAGCPNNGPECDLEAPFDPPMTLPININTIELQKLNLQPSDMLVATIKSDRLDPADLDSFKHVLQQQFPNNKTLVVLLPTTDSFELTVVSKGEIDESSTS